MRVLTTLASMIVAVALICGSGAGYAAGAKGPKKKAGRIHGKVKSVDAAAKSFVVHNKKKGDVAVTTDENTVFTKGGKAGKKGKAGKAGKAGTPAAKAAATPATFTDVKPGVRVRVQGTPAGEGKIAARKVRIAGKAGKKGKKGKKAAGKTKPTTQ